MGRRNGNYYISSNDVTIGYTSKDEPFKIDSDDFDKISQYGWTKNAQKKAYLVARIDGKIVRMHRLILGISDPKIVVDHINGDVADNRKCNLRKATQKQNSRNCELSKNNKLGYPGIRKKFLLDGSVRYTARICVDRKELFLGVFNSIEEAIEKRKDAENKYFGDFAPHKGALRN